MKFLPAASALASSLLLSNDINFSTAFVTPHGGRSIFQSSPATLFSSSSTTARFSAVAPQDAQQQEASQNNDEFGGVLTGEVLSILRPDSTTTNGGAAFAVVKVCEENLLPNSAYAVAKAMATADAAAAKNNEKEEDVTTEQEVEEEKVELASALFGKPMPQAVKESTAAAAKNGGAVGKYMFRDCAFWKYSYYIVVLLISNHIFHQPI